MSKYFCQKCETVVSAFPSGHCPTCGNDVVESDRVPEIQWQPEEKHPPQIKINGPRQEITPQITEEPEVLPPKRHVRPNPKDCDHPIVLEKRVSFSEEERNGAVLKGYSLPNQASMDFCVNCWQLNPEKRQ